MPETQFTALIINQLVWELMTALDPHVNELSFEENEGSYLVLNYDEETRWMIVTPTTFDKYFKHIENSDRIRTYKFIKK